MKEGVKPVEEKRVSDEAVEAVARMLPHPGWPGLWNELDAPGLQGENARYVANDHREDARKLLEVAAQATPPDAETGERKRLAEWLQERSDLAESYGEPDIAQCHARAAELLASTPPDGRIREKCERCDSENVCVRQWVNAVALHCNDCGNNGDLPPASTQPSDGRVSVELTAEWIYKRLMRERRIDPSGWSSLTEKQRDSWRSDAEALRAALTHNPQGAEN